MGPRAEAAQRPGRSIDDLYAEIDSAAPGFAGMYIDENGTLVLLDASAGGSARLPVLEGAVRAVAGQAFNLGEGRVTRRQPATFAFREMRGWLNRIVRSAVSSNIVLLDIDERRNRLVLGVNAATDSVALRTALSALAIPSGGIVIERVGPRVPLQAPGFPADTTLRHPVRPIKGGTMIQVEYMGTSGGSCTIGFTLRVGGVPHFLTASHCTENYASLDNGRHRQPYQVFYFGTTYDFWMSHESRDVPHIPRIGSPDCPGYAVACRYSDAALVRIDDTVAVEVGRVARTYTTNGEISLTGFPNSIRLAQNLGHWRVVGVEGPGWTAVVGQPVIKVGATTGQTSGVVVRTCQYLLDPSTPSVERKYLMCQNDVGATAAYCGDSGGPVFGVVSEADHTVTALGITIAGPPGRTCDGNIFNAFTYSPMQGIQNDLLQSALPWNFIGP